jgi:hypothetical protein
MLGCLVLAQNTFSARYYSSGSSPAAASSAVRLMFIIQTTYGM